MKKKQRQAKQWKVTRLDSNAHSILEGERDELSKTLQPHEPQKSLSDAVRHLKQKADRATV